MKGVHYFVSHLGGLRPDKSKKRARRRRKATFGQPLGKVIEHQEKKKASLKVPAIVEILLDYIINNGIETEGIFRISGSVDEVNNMIRLFSKKKIKNSGDIRADEIYNATSLLKDYIRSVPDELITAPITQACLQFTHSPFLSPIDASLLLLPSNVFHFLGEVFSLLHVIAQYSSINKMTFENLAIVMAPTMCHNPAQDLRSFKEFNDKNIKVIRTLIEQAPHLFNICYTHIIGLRKIPFPTVRISGTLSASSLIVAAKSGRLSAQSVPPILETQSQASFSATPCEPSEASRQTDESEALVESIQVQYVEVAPNVIEIQYFPPEEQVYKKLDRVPSTMLSPVNPDGNKSSSSSIDSDDNESHFSDISDYLDASQTTAPISVSTPSRPPSMSFGSPLGIPGQGGVPFRFDPNIHVIRHPALIAQQQHQQRPYHHHPHLPSAPVTQNQTRSLATAQSPSVLTTSSVSSDSSRTHAGSKRSSLHNLDAISTTINHHHHQQPPNLHRSAVLNAAAPSSDQTPRQQPQSATSLPQSWSGSSTSYTRNPPPSPVYSPRTGFPHSITRSAVFSNASDNSAMGNISQVASVQTAGLLYVQHPLQGSPLLSSSQLPSYPLDAQSPSTVSYLSSSQQANPVQPMHPRSMVIHPYQPYHASSSSYHSASASVASTLVNPSQVIYSPFRSSSYHAPLRHIPPPFPPANPQ